jgi:hypothetical protein
MNNVLAVLNVLASAGGIFVVLVAARLVPVPPRVRRALLLPGLVALCALAWGTYFRWGHFRFDRYVNPHDVFHYYVGSKYSRELGYTHLYRCALVADAEGRRVYRQDTIRDLATHRMESAAAAIAAGDECRRRFSPERWREFAKDVRYFISLMPPWKWNQVLRDKGYNATPVWNMIARALAERFPTDGRLGLGPLLALDPLLLMGMFALVWAAFGPRVTLLALLFFGCNFFMSLVHIKNSFLRLDWLVLLVAAGCLLRLGRPALAGACAGWAALSRVFPAVFVFGVGAKLVWEWRDHRRIDRRALAFFGALLAIALALGALSVASDGGTGLWREFADKIAVHNKDLSTTRIGFKYLLLTLYHLRVSWGAFSAGNAAWFQRAWAPWWVIQAAVLAVCFFAARRLEDHEAFFFGIVPVYFLTAPTFYYYVMLVGPFVWLVSRLDRPRFAVAAAWLFLTSLVGHLITARASLGLGQSYVLSWLLGAFVAYLGWSTLASPDPVAAETPADVDRA